MKVNIFNESFKKFIFRNDIKRVTKAILHKELKHNKLLRRFGNAGNWEINFLFVDDKDILKFNKRFFKRNIATDVISFSMLEGDDIKNNNTLGDAIISVETAEFNANEYGNTYKEELLLLVIHSVLHILGYDHETDNGEMRKKENEYFQELVKEYND